MIQMCSMISKIMQMHNDVMWWDKLAHPPDIFQKLNTLNSSMQDRKENIISRSDKMEC